MLAWRPIANSILLEQFGALSIGWQKGVAMGIRYRYRIEPAQPQHNERQGLIKAAFEMGKD